MEWIGSYKSWQLVSRLRSVILGLIQHVSKLNFCWSPRVASRAVTRGRGLSDIAFFWSHILREARVGIWVFPCALGQSRVRRGLHTLQRVYPEREKKLRGLACSGISHFGELLGGLDFTVLFIWNVTSRCPSVLALWREGARCFTRVYFRVSLNPPHAIMSACIYLFGLWSLLHILRTMFLSVPGCFRTQRTGVKKERASSLQLIIMTRRNNRMETDAFLEQHFNFSPHPLPVSVSHATELTNKKLDSCKHCEHIFNFKNIWINF